MRRVISVLLLMACPLLAAAPPRARHRRSLASRINAILGAGVARRGFWGIEVVRLPDGRRLYARNPSHLFQPASNMKLFTVAAALTLLPPGFQFRTTVESTRAPDAEGRVPDLILVGRGDPNLGSRVLPYRLKTETRTPADVDFQNLADQVAGKGVREVTGNLIADDSYYVDEPYVPEWAVGDLLWDYGAPVTALAFNDNSLKLQIEPGAAVDAKAGLTLEPISDYYMINNGVRTTAPGEPAKIFVNRFPGSRGLEVWGHIPEDSAGVGETIAIENPPQLIGEMFRRELAQRGVKVDGQVGVHRLTPLDAAQAAGVKLDPASRVVLAEHDSPPLREDLKVILKVSQNLHAEMLLRTLARQMTGEGSLEAGRKVLEGFAGKLGVTPEDIYFSDGSGLGRNALVTPDAMIKLLEFMARSPGFETFYDALPVAGIDGTLADRFERSTARGHIHAKTGSFDHVNTLSGYMDRAGRPRVAFVIMGDNDLLKWAAATRIVDRIAVEIYRSCAAGPTVR